MLKEQNDIDLRTLMDRFTECEDYTKKVILEELEYWQGQPDFLCITDGNGFLIGYRNRDSLWIAQVYNDGSLISSKRALDYAKSWARDRGMTSMVGETKRNEMRAMGRYGFKEFSVLMRIEL
jgi:hypothetical protein